jgi:hypothetical protein
MINITNKEINALMEVLARILIVSTVLFTLDDKIKNNPLVSIIVVLLLVAWIIRGLHGELNFKEE